SATRKPARSPAAYRDLCSTLSRVFPAHRDYFYWLQQDTTLQPRRSPAEPLSMVVLSFQFRQNKYRPKSFEGRRCPSWLPREEGVRPPYHPSQGHASRSGNLLQASSEHRDSRFRPRAAANKWPLLGYRIAER